MAKDLARAIGYLYIDSGAMYRAVTLYCLRHRLFTTDGTIDAAALENALPTLSITFRKDTDSLRPRTLLNGEDVEEAIRTMDVSSCVSPVAALGFVRDALVRQQQEMGKEKGIVMDGRDIGTVVFPKAELKIFVTASVEIRARRRYDELKSKGQEASIEEIRKNVEERDYIDQHRKTSPLRKAEDAIVLDNSRLTIDQQRDWLLERFKEAIHGQG